MSTNFHTKDQIVCNVGANEASRPFVWDINFNLSYVVIAVVDNRSIEPHLKLAYIYYSLYSYIGSCCLPDLNNTHLTPEIIMDLIVSVTGIRRPFTHMHKYIIEESLHYDDTRIINLRFIRDNKIFFSFVNNSLMKKEDVKQVISTLSPTSKLALFKNNAALESSLSGEIVGFYFGTESSKHGPPRLRDFTYDKSVVEMSKSLRHGELIYAKIYNERDNIYFCMPMYTFLPIKSNTNV